MQRSRIVVAVAALAGLIAFLRRPVRPPEPGGTWTPAERQSTRR